MRFQGTVLLSLLKTTVLARPKKTINYYYSPKVNQKHVIPLHSFVSK